MLRRTKPGHVLAMTSDPRWATACLLYVLAHCFDAAEKWRVMMIDEEITPT
jgi:hypothetical protein